MYHSYPRDDNHHIKDSLPQRKTYFNHIQQAVLHTSYFQIKIYMRHTERQVVKNIY